MESVELRTAFIERLGDNMLCTRYKRGFIIEEEDAKEIDDIQFQMTGGKETLLVVDILGIDNRVSKDAKDFFTKKGKMLPHTKGVAIVQEEDQSNLKTSFLSNWIKPIYPTETFQSRKAAIDWLNKL